MRTTRKTTHKITYQYTIEHTSLESVQYTKYLEVTDDLRWNRHAGDITGRANKLLGLLRRNLSTCDRKVKEAAYLGLVRPLLEYASQAWDPYTDNLSNEIEKTRRRAARFVTSDYQNYELGCVTKLLKHLGWKSLMNKREVDRLCLLKKGLDNNAILPLDELSKPARKTRHVHNRYYTTIYARTNIFKFSFVSRTIRDWNNLPHNVVEIADDPKFRKLLLFTILWESADPRCKQYHSCN